MTLDVGSFNGDPVYSAGNQSVLLSKENESVAGFQSLHSVMNVFIPRAQEIIREQHPATVPRKLLALVSQMLPAAFQAAMDGGLHATEKLELDRAKFEAVPSDRATDMSAESAYRERFYELEIGGKLKALRDWPMAGLFAVARVGREIYELTDNQWEIVLERLREHNLSNSPAVQASFTRKPNINDPLARGTDPEAVKSYVEQGLAQWKARGETLVDCRKELQQVCLVVAVLVDKTPEETFAILSGQTDA